MFNSKPRDLVIDLAQPFITDALANHDIQRHLSDAAWSRLWTVDGVTRHPTIRVEYEQAIIIGGLGESLAAAKHKHFGQLVGVKPLHPDDPVHPTRILFIYNANYAYSRRVEQRRVLKRLLGKEHRSLVTSASRSTKSLFLTHYLTESGTKAIRRRLKLEPGRFWRVAKGKEFLDLPEPPRQLLLFDE
jgi:hypothetical protein